jgi:poly(3-hydroxybutyrate) depolymerase
VSRIAERALPQIAAKSTLRRFARRGLIAGLLTLIVTVLAGAGTAMAATRPTGKWGTTSQNIPRRTIMLASGRQFDIQYPQPAWSPKPLIVMLPGLNQTPAQLDAVAQGNAFARTHGVTIAYGYPVAAASGKPAWNAGNCCEHQTADDVTYLSDVVTAAEQITSIDPTRVYVVGMSNGGMMALRALCDRPDIFAAAVSVAGPYLGTTCTRPTWLHLAGTADSIVPVSGGPAPFCGCTFPATTTEAKRFPGAQVQLVNGANHTWPQVDDHTWRFDGLTRAWTFLQTQTLPVTTLPVTNSGRK